MQHARISTEISRVFSDTVWTWHSTESELVLVQKHSQIHSLVFEMYLRIIFLSESPAQRWMYAAAAVLLLRQNCNVQNGL